ncbi:hypothetical protein WI74_28605 [Burkholderia ubonensis]|nr:hypothetical protein WI74_28605 [Burkholderia ubonensis]
MNTVKLLMVDGKTAAQRAKPCSADAGPMKSDVFERTQSSRHGGLRGGRMLCRRLRQRGLRVWCDA